MLAALALTLLCTAAGGAAAGLHTAAARAGPLPDLAQREAPATVEVTLTGDPRLARPRPSGGPRSLLVDATVDRVEHDGTATDVRTPVLVVVPAPDDAWSTLLPTTRLRLLVQVSEPFGDDGAATAVLRVRGSTPPGELLLDDPTTAQRLAGALRSSLRDATDGLPDDPRGLLPALVVGDASRIPPDLDDAVRAADMSHLIVVSGAHLGLVLAVVIGSPGMASRTERGGLAPRLRVPLRYTALLGGAVVLAFVVVCRPGPSVLRAAVCGGIALLALATGRRRSLLPALAAAVLLLILYDPGHARSFGFLLSVLATGALLTVAPGWSRALRRRGVPARVAEGLAIAAAAQTVCAPVVAVFTARVSLVAIPANLLAELGFAPALMLGWATLAVAPVAPWAAGALAWLASWPAWWIAVVARTAASLPGAEAGWPGGWAGAALLAVATVAGLVLLRRLPRHPWWAAGLALVLLLATLRPVPVAQFLSGWPPPDWRVVACDVGQGDALAVAAGPGSALVIDAGPDPDAVDGCLRDLGVRHVPLLVLTHFHADHVAGLSGVLRGRTVRAIQTSRVRDTPAQADQVDRTARAAGVPVTVAEPGERRRVDDDVSWQVLWPPNPADGLGANDASVTLLLRTGDLTVLLPGDLEPSSQRGLLAAHPDLPAVDVLKVAHHGSAYQHPPLLDRLDPRYAVISAGEDNAYGHPDAGTVRALEARDATVLRTDEQGDIAFTPAGATVRRPRRVAAPRLAGPPRRAGRVRPARRPATAVQASPLLPGARPDPGTRLRLTGEVTTLVV